jgi:DNA (cytosine-5)-methyltransferase 1
MKQFNFIEVCAGCGGFSSGFLNAGFDALLLNELDKTCCATLQTNHKDVVINNASMKELDLSIFKGKVDVLLGGVPCQSFSQAGRRKGIEDSRGSLILDFNRLVKDCEPRMFVIENVKGLTTFENGKLLHSLISLFGNNGQYKIYYKVLNAKDFEVPQKRERVFIVGVHSSISQEFHFPTCGNHPDVRLKDVLHDVPPSIGVQYPEWKRKILELVPAGGCWVDLPIDIQQSYMGENGLKSTGGKRGVARRLDMNEYCLTLTTSPYQKQTERCHPLETRPLTIREYARIQTFPDTYLFCGSVLQQYKQIGNAVPVKLAYHLATHIKKFLQNS